jgi:peptidoglycan/LPS O-acetylase OafA/YrhL
MSTQEKLFFPALTGYRAIAAWMIFVFHFMPFRNPSYPDFAKRAVSTFHIGVEMFFVLSGFLITYRYFNERPINFKKFMVNRVARIYPMYFLLTALFFVIYYFQSNIWNTEKTIEAILSFTMTKALFSKYYFAGIAQGWTLTLEEMFYITAPFYFILIRKNKWFLLLLPIFLFASGNFLKNLTNVPENSWGFLQYDFYFNIFEFFAGITLAYLTLKKRISFSRNWVTWFGLSIIILFIFGKGYLPHDTKFSQLAEVIFLSFFGIAPLLWGLIYEKTIIQKILGSRIFVLLGKSSYVFYLIHKGFIPVFMSDYITDNKLVIFVLLNVLSVLMFTYLEEPLNHFIRKKFNSKKI